MHMLQKVTSISNSARPEHAAVYRLRVDGRIPENWQNRLGNLQVIHEKESSPNVRTTLEGPVKDQSDLLGILNTLHQLRATLLLVEALDA